MPTYYALGVKATLATCDLQESVSNVIDLKMGADQKKDAARFEEALDGATLLLERGIGEGGHDFTQGGPQFIGAKADMPMKMVEAGMTLNPRDLGEWDGGDEDMDKLMETYVFDDDVDSPLTSLGANPTATQLNFVSGSHALVLNISLGANAFVPNVWMNHKGHEVKDNKDLKVEIFLNGELVEVDFVSERLLKKGNDVKLQYMGTRIHRQIQKPWAYIPSELGTDAGTDASGRWNAVSQALMQESDVRGRDMHGDTAPSTEYLIALSQIAMPDRIKYSKGTGIVDVVITAGKGLKYSAEGEYLVAPTRFDDPAYTQGNPTVNPALLVLASPYSSPEIPLAHTRTRAKKIEFTTPTYKSQKTKEDLLKELDLKGNMKKTFITGFEDSHGRGKSKGRSLYQRLADVKMMNAQNQAKEIEKLREEFGEQNEPETVEEPEPVGEPMKKKLKIEVPGLGFVDPPTSPLVSLLGVDSEDDVLEYLMNYSKIGYSPRQASKQTLSPAAADEDNLTQSRMDLARELGADEDGYLMNRIASASTSAASTPLKRTKASALANSPARVPVKTQKFRGRSATPQHSNQAVGDIDDTPIPFSLGQPTMNVHAAQKASNLARKASMALTGGTPSRGAGRSSRAWMPKEKTPAEAVKDFEVPALSVGSCVSYAPDLGAVGGAAAVGGRLQRQIAKVRSGEFREKEVVVGMSFCVV